MSDRSEEYLNEIRKSEGLSRAVLRKIVVDGKTVVFYLVTDKTYRGEDLQYAREVSRRFVPEGYGADVNLFKSVPSEEGVRREIAEILKARFPSVAAFLSPEDIAVSVVEGGGRYLVSVSRAERDQSERGNILDALTEELNRRFCGSWYGDFRIVEKETGEIEREELPPAEPAYAPRVFPIGGYAPIDGGNPTSAIYIADLRGEMENVTVCGTVTYAEERLTKKEKPYFSFTVSDGSGQLRTSYFSRKATLEKVRGIKQGDVICLTGANELYNGNYSFRAKYVDYGKPPEGFVPESRPSRPVPARYQTVFPESVSDHVQSALFGETALPESFKEKNFVVFDLETTGLNYTPAGGAMDRIIEIGAVKITGGTITEKFSSFIACPVKLSEEIVNLTGIRDEMLVGAPEAGDVLADFYKFCDGCSLVGHNVQFDFGFIRYYGEKEGFIFENRLYDTFTFSQETLRLKNYKLNTVADYFGFTFHHHRAFDDAFVTAKVFIELVRMKGGLPL